MLAGMLSSGSPRATTSCCQSLSHEFATIRVGRACSLFRDMYCSARAHAHIVVLALAERAVAYIRRYSRVEAKTSLHLPHKVTQCVELPQV